MANDFYYSDVYPQTMGSTVAEVATLDPEDVALLANEETLIKTTNDKAKQYNIVSAIVVLILLIILLQMVK